jgi:hypothetical protein
MKSGKTTPWNFLHKELDETGLELDLTQKA